jgi:hypothetical protein
MRSGLQWHPAQACSPGVFPVVPGRVGGLFDQSINEPRNRHLATPSDRWSRYPLLAEATISGNPFPCGLGKVPMRVRDVARQRQGGRPTRREASGL